MVDTDHEGFDRALQQSGEDLGAFRIFDPDHPTVPIIAAGAPWFMTVFGRDSLLTAYMASSPSPASPKACSRRSRSSRAAW